MRKRRLEIILSQIPPHPKPRLSLEQYTTPPHLAARLLWIAAYTYGDIIDQEVIDLGAGTGRLGLGAAILGSSYVVLVDVDVDALRVSLEQAERLGLRAWVDAVCSDVRMFRASRKVDCIVQNPPFGVHRRGADVEFLEAAIRLANVIYSIHKAETLDYLRGRVRRAGRGIRLLFEEVVRLPPTMPHHYKREHVVRVGVVRISN